MWHFGHGTWPRLVVRAVRMFRRSGLGLGLGLGLGVRVPFRAITYHCANKDPGERIKERQAEHRASDAHQGDDGGEGIGAVVPRVGDEHGRVDAHADGRSEAWGSRGEQTR